MAYLGLVEKSLKPNDKWAERLLVPRRKRGKIKTDLSLKQKIKNNTVTKEMAKTWNAKLKKSKISRSSTGRLPMSMTTVPETEEERAAKARKRANRKKDAEERWKVWNKEKQVLQKKKGKKPDTSKQDLAEKEAKRQAAVNAFNEWQREKIRKNRALVKEIERKAHLLSSIETEKSKLLEERAVLLQNKARARQGASLLALGAGGVDAPDSLSSIASSAGMSTASFGESRHRRRKRRAVTKKLKKLMKTPYTQQMIKSDEAHYEVWGKKKDEKQSVPKWLVPPNVAQNMGWKEEIENPNNSRRQFSPTSSSGSNSPKVGGSPPPSTSISPGELAERSIVLPSSGPLPTLKENSTFSNGTQRKKRSRRKKKKDVLRERPPWNGNEYEMRPRQDLNSEGDDGTYVGAPKKKKNDTSVKRTGGGFEKPDTLDAQRARVAVNAAVRSGAVKSREALEAEAGFKELGKIVDSKITGLLAECMKRDGEKRGVVSRDDFSDALVAVGFSGSENERNVLLQELDHRSSGYIKYQELAVIEKERIEREKQKGRHAKKLQAGSAKKKKKTGKSPLKQKLSPVPSLDKTLKLELDKPGAVQILKKKSPKAPQKEISTPSIPVPSPEKSTGPQPWLMRAKQRQQAEQARRLRAMVKTPSSDIGVPGRAVPVKSATFDQLDERAIAALCTADGPKPPPLIMRILGSVCMLVGENPTWLVAQRIVNEPEFRDRLRKFNATSVTEETLHRLQRVTHHPRFSPETLVEDEKYCAFAPLCDWVLEAVTASDEHFREKWASIGMAAPTGSFGEGNDELDEATAEALREQKEAEAAIALAEKDAALALKERIEADRAKKIAQEKARFAGIARREAEVALKEAAAEEEEATRAREDMERRGDTSEYARAILEKEEREARLSRQRAHESLKNAEKAERDAENALDLYHKEEEEARAMEKLADEEAHAAKLEAQEAEIAKRRAQLKVKEAKEVADDEARAQREFEENRSKEEHDAKMAAEKLLAEKEEEERQIQEARDKALEEERRIEEAKVAKLKEREEEMRIEAEMAHQQALKALKDSDRLEMEEKVAKRNKPVSQMTRREVLLEKRREKSLRRVQVSITDASEIKPGDDDVLSHINDIMETDQDDTEALEEEQRALAATKIQKLQRGKADRQMLVKQKNAAAKIQHIARGRQERAIAVKRTQERKKHFANVYSDVRELENSLQELFDTIDKHGQGKISKKDIMMSLGKPAVSEMINECPPLKPLLHPRTYKETFNAMDTNHDGSVDFQELRMFCTGMYSMDASKDIAVKSDLAMSALEESDFDLENREAQKDVHNDLKSILMELFEAMGHGAERKITKVDLMHGLHKDNIRDIIRKCAPLQPLLKPRAFWATLMAIDTDNDGFVTFEEVRGFCSGVVAAQNSVVLNVKEAMKMLKEISATLDAFYDISGFSKDAPVPLQSIIDKLDEPYALSEIATLTPILQLREQDRDLFLCLKQTLLALESKKLASHSYVLPEGQTLEEALDAIEIKITYDEMVIYCAGLCAGWGHVKLRTDVKQYPRASPEYDLNQALNNLYTIMRVEKLDLHKYAPTKKVNIIHYVTDPIVKEKLELCATARVLLEPEWYWSTLTILPVKCTASMDEISQDELRVFLCGLNEKYLVRQKQGSGKVSRNDNVSREYIDRIGGKEKTVDGSVRFVWPNKTDRFIGKHTTEVEEAFYEHMAATNTAIRRIIPRFGGICYHHAVKYVSIENISKGFSSPCIMDVKIGSDKQGKKLGLGDAYELVGMRIWNPDFEQFVDIGADDETDCSYEHFLTLGSSKTIVRIDLLREIVSTLKTRLESLQSKHNNMDFFGSSLLIAYDADDFKPNIRCLLVDFEKVVVLRKKDAVHKDNIALGIRNLINRFESLANALQKRLFAAMFTLYDACKLKRTRKGIETIESPWEGVRECAHIELPNLIARSVRLFVQVFDRDGRGHIDASALKSIQSENMYQSAVKLSSPGLHDLLHPQKSAELVGKLVNKVQKDQVTYEKVYNHCIREEALAAGEAVSGLGVEALPGTESDDEGIIQDHFERKEWLKGLKDEADAALYAQPYMPMIE